MQSIQKFKNYTDSLENDKVMDCQMLFQNSLLTQTEQG